MLNYQIKSILLGSFFTVISFLVGFSTLSFEASLNHTSAQSKNQASSPEINSFVQPDSNFAVPQEDPRVGKLVEYFKSQNSPIADPYYASLIIKISDENQADYRVNVALMLIESGICKQPYKQYNCFGYLNGVQYSSFEESIIDITTKVSQDYTNPFGKNYRGLITRYGIHNVDKAEATMIRTVNRLDNVAPYGNM